MNAVNPGKRGLLTILAVLIIVGVPGVIAYADSSDDTYCSILDEGAVPDTSIVYSESDYSFGFTAVEDGSGFDIVIDDVASDDSTTFGSLTSVTSITLFDSDATLSDNVTKISITTDYENLSKLRILFFSGSSVLCSYYLEYDEDLEAYVYEFSAVEQAANSSATRFGIQIRQESGEADSEFYIQTDIYSSESIFTDDVVELIVMVGGILLLICGTFALSFIDVGTPGKAVSGFKSAGRKIKNYGRGKN